jgi:hypothetical protein
LLRRSLRAITRACGDSGAWGSEQPEPHRPQIELGPNFAVEFAPIEKWLEIEAGVTPLFTRSSTEWDVDVLFKKPWDLSTKLDFMVGIGPSWIRTKQNGVGTNVLAGVFVLDFMYPPSIRVVSGAELRVHLRASARTIDSHQRGTTYCDPEAPLIQCRAAFGTTPRRLNAG